MGRVEDYLDGRLRGRAIPDDLRRLVELELDGALAEAPVQPFAEVHLLAPGEIHALQDPQYRGDDPDTLANSQAIDDVLAHMAVLVDGFNGDLFGYWLHPAEPATNPPAIVKLDTEGQFETLDGATLAEAMVFDWLGYDTDDEYLAAITEYCTRHGLPMAARSREDLTKAQPAVDPALLHDRRYRTYRPYTPRPTPAAEEGAAPVGLRLTDQPLRELLAQLGFADPQAAVAALDDGTGEVRLQSEHANIRLTLYLDQEQGWWLYSVRYRRPTTELPLQLPLPYGFSLHEDRQATRERFGPPKHTAILPVDRWQLGTVVGYVAFEDDAGLPATIEFWPEGVHRRS